MPIDLHPYFERRLNEAGLEFCAFVTIAPKTGPALGLLSGTAQLGRPVEGVSDWDYDLLDAVQNIHEISPIEMAMDPVTRKTQVGRVEVVCVDDGSVRALAAANNVKGADVFTRMVPVDSAPGLRWFNVWRGVVSDITAGDGLVTIKCADALALATEVEFRGSLTAFVGLHPLEAIVSVLEALGITGIRIDSEAFDPTNHPEISHLVVGPGFDMTEADEKRLFNAVDFIDALAVQCGGAVFMNSEGKASFSRFAQPTAVHDTWDAYDILELRVLQTMEGMLNEVHVQFGRGTYAGSYVRRDRQSQSDHAAADLLTRIVKHEVEMPFAGAVVHITDENGQDLETSATEVRINVGPCSGMRVDRAKFHDLPGGTAPADVTPFTQPAGADLASNRFVYLQLEDEIIRVYGAAIATTLFASTFTDVDRLNKPTGRVHILPNRMTATGFERGYGETDSADHDVKNGVDITAPVLFATTLLERCRNGLPKIAARTTWAKFRYELGDIIKVDTDEGFLWGTSDLSGLWWEVVKRRFHPIEGWFEWELAFAKNDSSPSTADPVDVPVNPPAPEPVVGKWHIDGDQTHAVGGGHEFSFDEFTIVWDEEAVSGSIGSMDATTGVWTCQRSGVYRVEAQVLFAIGAMPDAGLLRVYVNDVLVASPASTGTEAAQISATLPIEVGDEIEVVCAVLKAVPGDVTVTDANPATWLAIEFIGPLP